ncbi:MAG TPA: hypothetical protein PLN69_06115 [bacterium]|nr:hypothetical protein [bacterium]
MQISNMAPETFFPFLESLSKGQTSTTGLYFSASQALNLRREIRVGDFSSTRLAHRTQTLFSKTTPLLEDSFNSVFKSRSMNSGNSMVATGSAADGAFLSNFDISVKQTATSQSVYSDALKSYEPMELPRSVYEFVIDRGLRTDRFRITTSGSDTNRDVIEKIVDEINSSDIGVTASTVENYSSSTVRLMIQGIDKSEMSMISVRDTSGDILDRLGVSTVSYATSSKGGLGEVTGEAIFSVNGQTFHSGTNTAHFYENLLTVPSYRTDPYATPEELYEEWYENGGLENYAPQTKSSQGGIYGDYSFSLKLEGANSGTAALPIREDLQKISSAIGEFVTAFNNTLDELRPNPVFGYRQAKGYLEGVLSSNKQELESFGITKTASGYEVDMEVLESKLRTDFEDVKSLFGGPGGVAEKTVYGVRKILNAPMTGISRVESTGNDDHFFNVAGLFYDGSF